MQQEDPQLIEWDQPVRQAGGERGGVQGQGLRAGGQRAERCVGGVQRAEHGTAGFRGGLHGRRPGLVVSCPGGRATGPGVITHEGLLVTG